MQERHALAHGHTEIFSRQQKMPVTQAQRQQFGPQQVNASLLHKHTGNGTDQMQRNEHTHKIHATPTNSCLQSGYESSRVSSMPVPTKESKTYRDKSSRSCPHGPKWLEAVFSSRSSRDSLHVNQSGIRRHIRCRTRTNKFLQASCACRLHLQQQ